MIDFSKNIIIIDTREQTPFEFPDRVVVRRKLDFGDYSIDGYTNDFAVERKSKNDLVNTVIHNRERFEKELSRAKEASCLLTVMVECHVQDIIQHRYQSDAKPPSVLGAIDTLEQKYGISFMFAGSIWEAAIVTEIMLDKYARIIDSINHTTRAVFDESETFYKDK